MAEANSLTATEARRHLSCNPETGEFRWLISGKGRPGVGEMAGCKSKALGYWLIGLNYRRYWAHRLAWLITHGRWPEHQIDHINGDRTDNRLCNLREVTHAQNQLNRHHKRPNRFGFRGVDKVVNSPRYTARVVIGRVKHNLGTFDTPEEAHAAYLEAKARLHGAALPS
jgi:hypothetical protein